MTEELIKNNPKFKEKCKEFGLLGNKFVVMGEIIVILMPDNLYMLMDEYFNVIDIIAFDNGIDINKSYNNYHNVKNKNYTDKINYPFSIYSIKDIHNVGNKTEFYEDNVNYKGEHITDLDNIYVYLLAYNKFVDLIIEDYWKSFYSFIVLGFDDIPNLSNYLNRIVYFMQRYIKENLDKGIIPTRENVLNYIGETNYSNPNLVDYIIKLVALYNGYNIIDGKLIKCDNVSNAKIDISGNVLLNIAKDHDCNKNPIRELIK